MLFLIPANRIVLCFSINCDMLKCSDIITESIIFATLAVISGMPIIILHSSYSADQVMA